MIGGISISNSVAGALIWVTRMTLRSAVLGIGLTAGIVLLLLLSSIGLMNTAADDLRERGRSRQALAAQSPAGSQVATAEL